MNIGSIVTTTNTLSEDAMSANQVVEFINDAIARINITCGANYPFMSTSDGSDYVGFTEKWQRALFIPFVVARMKQVDSSQFEYQDRYAEFERNLFDFKTKYPVPDLYKDTNEVLSVEPDFTDNIYAWNADWIGVGPLDMVDGETSTVSGSTSSGSGTTTNGTGALDGGTWS